MKLRHKWTDNEDGDDCSKMLRKSNQFIKYELNSNWMQANKMDWFNAVEFQSTEIMTIGRDFVILATEAPL